MRMTGLLRSLVLAAVLALAVAAPAMAAPTWLPASNLSTAPSAGVPGSAQIASDDAGETLAAWIRNDGQNDRVQLAGHGPGTPWSAATDISENNQNAAFPSLALSPTGFGALAWSRSDGSKLRVQVVRRAPGGAFGPAFTASAVPIDSIEPAVAVDAVGDVVVIWMDSSRLAAHARRYTASSNSWGAVEDLVPGLGAFQTMGSLALVMSATGTATGAWSVDTDNLSNTSEQYQVQTRSQAPGGAWTPVQALSTTGIPDQSAATQLAVDAAGNVTAVWSDYRIGPCTPPSQFCKTYVIAVVKQSTRGAVSGVWSPAATLSDPNLISDAPRVATTPAGEVTVAWTEQVAQAIKVVTRPVGGAFPPADAATIILPQDKQISSSGARATFPVTSLRVAAGPAGTVVSFARLEDGDNALAEAVYKPAGASWPPRRRSRRSSRLRASTSVRTTARTSRSTGSGTPWSRGRATWWSRLQCWTSRHPRSPRSTCPPPGRRDSRSRCPPPQSTCGRRSGRDSRAGTSATARPAQGRPSATCSRRPARTRSRVAPPTRSAMPQRPRRARS